MFVLGIGWNKCKNLHFKTVFNGDTAYITRQKKNQKRAITFAARRHVNVHGAPNKMFVKCRNYLLSVIMWCMIYSRGYNIIN